MHLLQSEIADALRNQPNLELSSRGEHQLKHVGRPLAVFLVQGTPGAPGPAKRRPDTGDGKNIRTLAVLPLENLGPSDHEYVADGVTDALIESLARVGPELLVISRTSVKQYKGTTKPAREIADELGVEFLIEGTAQRRTIAC
jgi:adenylate cyclase